MSDIENPDHERKNKKKHHKPHHKRDEKYENFNEEELLKEIELIKE